MSFFFSKFIVMNLIPNCIRTSIISKNLSQDQRSIQVSLLGGHTNLGKTTCFLLKQNPLLTCIKLHGEKIVDNIAKDLNLIDTKCRVEAFLELPKALRGTDIVLILKDKEYKETTSISDRILGEAKRVYNITKECTINAPRSIILVAVPPVSIFTPLVTNIFKQSNFYNPTRIIGSAAMTQVKLNTMVGRYQDLDPYICQVPFVGGPDMDLAVPLFTRTKPVEVNYVISECLTARFRQADPKTFPNVHCRKDFIENHDFSEAFALNNMISTLCFGLMGDKRAFYNAFIRSNIVLDCKHLVTTLQFGKNGVLHNCGLPYLTKFELDMFERAITDISKREKMAQEIIKSIEESNEVPSFIDKREKKNVLMN